MKLLTKNNYDFYEMLSMLQKGIRRNLYSYSSFAANEIKERYRKAMWNRLFVIGCEDCFGVISKEILNLYKKDNLSKADENIENAITLLCSSKKSRDACYFACNFILATRKGKDYLSVPLLKEKISDIIGIESLFGYSDEEQELINISCLICEGIAHRDCDTIGFYINKLRLTHRDILWKILLFYTELKCKDLTDEIKSLVEMDYIVNKTKKEKDEIFVSKAVCILLYFNDDRFNSVLANERIKYRSFICNFDKCDKLENSILENGKIPMWVFDCHTIKGRMLGKTDWDMTTDEQKALTPLQIAYFDDASWFYIYEQDNLESPLPKEYFEKIVEYSKTHEANPIKPI